MKRTVLRVKPYVFDDLLGHIVLFVFVFKPEEKEGTPLSELLRRFGGPQREMVDPFTHEKYRFDLAPWLHLPPETGIRLNWGFMPAHPIPLSDPRHPFRRWQSRYFERSPDPD